MSLFDTKPLEDEVQRLVEKARWICQAHVGRGDKMMTDAERMEVEVLIAEVAQIKAQIADMEHMRALGTFKTPNEEFPTPEGARWEDDMDAMAAYQKACDQFDKGYTS